MCLHCGVPQMHACLEVAPILPHRTLRVLAPLTRQPVKLLERMYHGTPTNPEEEVVVLGQVLACDATLGYEDIYNVQVSGLGCLRVLALHQGTWGGCAVLQP